MADTQDIDRSYIDNYAIKEFITNNLIQKYFPDIDVSLRTVGMLGITSELISNIAEDSFNTASVLFRESFPNRAVLPESIYSHAAIFQLSNIFSQAASCSFLIVLEEDSIINNMEYNKTTGMYYFYLDKNTTVYVENIPYTLDYDIRIKCVKKKTSNSEKYIFTAEYVREEYKNSISEITDPYIKLRKSNNGFIALEVTMHQVTRDVHFEPIITNSKINMPTIDIVFDGQLVGFDVLYKTPEETTYTKQMQKLLIYSQPLTTEFCYYQLYNDNTLRLSFNARDNYFTPKFNSELKVILYLSKGAEANFDVYKGSNITIEPDVSVYNYDSSILMLAKPLSGSQGGMDRLGIDALQSLTIENYRTAQSLTTESDLNTFFANYKHSYGDFAIKFVKRRNDVYERIFGGYCLMQYASEIFKTNTLDIHMNLSDIDNIENNVYIIEPGTIFTYKNNEDKYVSFCRDLNNNYYEEYETAIKQGEIPFVENPTSTTPKYLLERNASFAEFKKRKGYDDKVRIFDFDNDEQVASALSKSGTDFGFVNPFLIKFTKSPNLVSFYQTYINEKSSLDFTDQNEDAFVQFVSYQVQIERSFEKNKEYTVKTSIMPSITLDKEYPVIAKLGVDSETGETIYNINNRFTLDKNDLRVLFVIYNNGIPVCYSEMYPTSFTDETNLMYETKFTTDDHITSANKLCLLQDTIYLVEDAEIVKSFINIGEDDGVIDDIEYGWYFKENSVNNINRYSLYDKNDNLILSSIDMNYIMDMKENGCIKKFSKLINMDTSINSIQIPMENVECKIFTLYRRKYQDTELGSSMVLTDETDTNNLFYKFDDTYTTYIWTNEYSTNLEPLTFIKPLNYVRSHAYFENYLEKDDDGNYIHDIMDMRMESIPFIKWNLATNKDSMNLFMNVFSSQYETISNIITNKLRNETSIDIKFYNTYGKSTNYFIGEGLESEQLNTLNLRIVFDMWFIHGTNTVSVVPEIKQFIKSRIETLSDDGTNIIHASNLMREIEDNFSYVDHIRFRGFNNYDTSYQSIILNHTDIDSMSKEDRRKYVPELLVIDIDNIIINEYEV